MGRAWRVIGAIFRQRWRGCISAAVAKADLIEKRCGPEGPLFQAGDAERGFWGRSPALSA